jgi:hypothetical protein
MQNGLCIKFQRLKTNGASVRLQGLNKLEYNHTMKNNEPINKGKRSTGYIDWQATSAMFSTTYIPYLSNPRMRVFFMF